METGSRLRISGEGEAGVNGGPSGDLFVVVHVKEHETFERQGANLYSAVPISFGQAALGAEIKVQTLDGEEDLKIPAGTQTGTVFRLRSQGMPVLGGRGKGDLFVAVTLITPKSLTKEQRKLLEKLATIEDTDFNDASFMPTVAPQNILWARHQHVFAGLSWEESKGRYYQQLYYQDVDAKGLDYLLKNDFVTQIALFGWGRHTDRLSVAAKPLTYGEIDDEVENYSHYIESFGKAQASNPTISYVVIPNDNSFDLSKLEQWYKLDGGEVIGGHTIYKAALK